MVGQEGLRSPAGLWMVSAIGLLLLCWLAFFNGLGSLGLLDKTEALFVEVGHQMHLRNDWITPWWNGETFFDYPVWGYWMVALSFRCFGVSEWAARIPVALAASSVVVACFGLMLAWSPRWESRIRRFSRAGLAAGVMATCPGWIGWGRISTTDMFLASSISLALMSFLLAHRWRGHRRAALGRMALAVFCGIAVLAKGPIGVLLPGLVIVVFLTLSRSWNGWVDPRSILAMAMVFLGVSLPWYAAATEANGMEFLGGFLGFSNIQRFTTVIYDHPGPFWFYLPWLLVLLLPWSLYLPVAVAESRFWRWCRWPSEKTGSSGHLRGGDPTFGTSPPAETHRQLSLFLVLWLVLMVGFFSVAATKLPGYILPALPAGALLVTLHWRPFPVQVAADGSQPVWPRQWSGWLNALLLALMALAAVLSPRWVADDPAYPDFGAALGGSGLPFRLGLILLAAALALVVLLLRPGGRKWLWVPDLMGFLAVLALVIAPLAPLMDQQRQRPLRTLARAASLEALPGEPLWVVGSKRYSILFYGGEKVAFVSRRRSLDHRLAGDPGALGIGPGSSSVRLIGDRSRLEELQLEMGAVELLSRQGEQELWRVSLSGLRNRPSDSS